MTIDDDDAYAPTLGLSSAATLGPSLVTPNATRSSDASDTPLPSAGDSLETNELLAGRYRLKSLLGMGGMGAVYRAYDSELEEDVALKVLRSELVGSSEALARFRREVKLARKVTHRNVARTFDIAEHRGAKFLTMELVVGRSLAAELGKNRRPATDLVRRIVEGVTSGLSAAHSVGVVHRDLKPDNVILANDGRVVLTDFGIAHARTDDSAAQLTSAGFVGTPAYMAPEQVDGSNRCDGRTDLYAFGVMLFEMLTGRPAWPGTSPLLVAVARLQSPPPDLATFRPDLGPLASVVARCLAREPDERFSSADELRDAALAAFDLLSSLPRSESIGPPSMATPSSAPQSHGALGTSTSLQHGRSTPPSSRVVAVLPLRNLGSSDDGYLAEGLTEDLTDALSMTPGLRVASRGTVARAAEQSADSSALGRSLGADVVVEGSVRRAGELLRVSARIIAAADGFQLWAQRFDRPASEALVVSDLVARAVAEALTVSARADERAVPSSAEAVELYLRGRAAYRRDRIDDVEEAAALLDRATALAPHDPQVLAACALAHNRVAFVRASAGTSNAGDDRPLLLAQQAVRLAPRLPDAHVALGANHLRRSELRHAIVAFRTALHCDAEHADALGYLGRVLADVGDLRVATRLLERALANDPATRGILRDLVRAYALAERWSDVEEQLVLLEAREGKNLAVYVTRLRLACWKRDADVGRHLASQLNGFEPNAQGYLRIAAIGAVGLATPDDVAHVRLVLRMSSQTAPGFAILSAQLVVESMTTTGQLEVALEALAHAVDLGLGDANWANLCPALAALRERPEFRALTARIDARAQQALLGMSEPIALG
jgi:serine/threonine protein kinase/tetratricopeptide (TPR) repeat protein